MGLLLLHPLSPMGRQVSSTVVAGKKNWAGVSISTGEREPLQRSESFPSPGSTGGSSWRDEKGRRGQLRERLRESHLATLALLPLCC